MCKDGNMGIKQLMLMVISFRNYAKGKGQVRLKGQFYQKDENTQQAKLQFSIRHKDSSFGRHDLK